MGGDIIKKFQELPAFINYEGVEFVPKLFNNSSIETRLVYEISSVDYDSKHYEHIETYGCWNNHLLLEEGYACSFLYLVEGILADIDLIEAIDECLQFLKKNNLLDESTETH